MTYTVNVRPEGRCGPYSIVIEPDAELLAAIDAASVAGGAAADAELRSLRDERLAACPHWQAALDAETTIRAKLADLDQARRDAGNVDAATDAALTGGDVAGAIAKTAAARVLVEVLERVIGTLVQQRDEARKKAAAGLRTWAAATLVALRRDAAARLNATLPALLAGGDFTAALCANRRAERYSARLDATHALRLSVLPPAAYIPGLPAAPVVAAEPEDELTRIAREGTRQAQQEHAEQVRRAEQTRREKESIYA